MSGLTAEELKAIQERASRATPGPWFWNSYNAINSVPLTKAFIEVEEAHNAAGNPFDEQGDYAGEWKERFAAVEPSFAWVPPTKGDTATGRHAEDAVFIAEARRDIPALLRHVATLQGQLTRTRMVIAWAGANRVQLWSRGQGAFADALGEPEVTETDFRLTAWNEWSRQMLQEIDAVIVAGVQATQAAEKARQG